MPRLQARATGPSLFIQVPGSKLKFACLPAQQDFTADPYPEPLQWLLTMPTAHNSPMSSESAQTLDMVLGSSQHPHDKMTGGFEQYQRLSLKLKSPVFLDKSQAGLHHIPEGGEQLTVTSGTLMMPKLGLKASERSWINISFKQTDSPGEAAR